MRGSWSGDGRGCGVIVMACFPLCRPACAPENGDRSVPRRSGKEGRRRASVGRRVTRGRWTGRRAPRRSAMEASPYRPRGPGHPGPVQLARGGRAPLPRLHLIRCPVRLSVGYGAWNRPVSLSPRPLCSESARRRFVSMRGETTLVGRLEVVRPQAPVCHEEDLLLGVSSAAPPRRRFRRPSC